MKSFATPHPLYTLLKPSSVAIIGASPNTKKISGELLHFMQAGGYLHEIYPVNPSYEEIGGLRCFADIEAATTARGATIDLALLAIPARSVLPEIKRCGQAGVRNVAIITSGFAEAGGDSARMQGEMTELAKKTGMRILGPNSEGFFNAIDHVSATFSATIERAWATPKYPYVSADRVGVIAQSGGMGFAILNYGLKQGVQFSYVITSGNEADLSMADYLDFLVDDDDTKVIALFCESIRNGALFKHAALRAQRAGKPIVAIKAGKSVAGQRASASHTASLAGWSAAYDAVFARYAVIQVHDIEEAVAACGMLLTSPRVRGNRAVVMTGSGGAGVLVADTLERNGFVLPVLPEELQGEIRKHTEAYATPQNPVDITTAGHRSGAYALVLERLAASDCVDLVITVNSFLGEAKIPVDPPKISTPLRKFEKPFACFSYTAPSEFARGKMAEVGIYVNSNLNAMGVALAAITKHARTHVPKLIHPISIPASVTDTLSVRGLDVLCEYEVKGLLGAVGIKASTEVLARNVGEAAAAAGKIGFPVALKVQSPALTHKTEMGAVRLNVRTQAELQSAYAEMLETVERRMGMVDVHGFLVQRMAPPGYEVIVGTLWDASWGPLMMVGMGGVSVEVSKDVAYCLSPVTPAEAEATLRSLKSAALFNGFRGNRAIDLRPLAEMVSTLSLLADALGGNVAELELNPVIVHADGSGFTIADALLRKRSANGSV